MFKFLVRYPRVSALVGLTLLAASLIILGVVSTASAHVTQVDGPEREVVKHNRVTFRTHVPGTNYTYVELRDGSEWMATPCPTEDSRNCWHDDGLGWSFLNIHGHQHRYKYTARPAPSWTSRPCASRYAVDCQQNHTAHAYVVHEFPGRVHLTCVMYLDKAYAKHHDYCA